MLQLSLKAKAGSHNGSWLLVDSSTRTILVSERHAFSFQAIDIAAPNDPVLHELLEDR
jgi:hypothetical protein